MPALPARSVLVNAAVVPAATIGANIFSYALLLAAARLLSSSRYGELSALLGILLVATVPQLALQTVTARRTATRADVAGLRAATVIAGVGAAAVLVAVSPLLGLFLHLGSVLGVCLVAISVPASTALGTMMGQAQGRQDFNRLATVTALTTLGRSVGGLVGLAVGRSTISTLTGIALGLSLVALGLLRYSSAAQHPLINGPSDSAGSTGSAGGSAGSAVGHQPAVVADVLAPDVIGPEVLAPDVVGTDFARADGAHAYDTQTDVAHAKGTHAEGANAEGANAEGANAESARRGGSSAQDTGSPWPLLSEAFHAAHAHIAFLIVTSLDVLLARHLLDADDAGLYAVGSVVTRAALWLPQSVGLMLFASMSVPERHTTAVRRAIGIVVGIGVISVLSCLALGGLVVDLVGGSKYHELSDYVWIFALLGVGLALVQLSVLAGLARRRPHRVLIIWLTAALDIGLVLALGSDATPFRVVSVLALIAVLGAVSGCSVAVRPAAEAARRSDLKSVAGAGSGFERPVQ